MPRSGGASFKDLAEHVLKIWGSLVPDTPTRI